jgi:hypothetical protein
MDFKRLGATPTRLSGGINGKVLDHERDDHTLITRQRVEILSV